MVIRCGFIDPVMGDRCSSDAAPRAVELDYGVGSTLAREVFLCRRHYDQMRASVLVGAAEAV